MTDFLSVDGASLGTSGTINEGGFTQTVGTNRVVYATVSYEHSTAPGDVTDPQWGGEDMEPVQAGATLARGTVGAGFSAWNQVFQIREADLPADGGTKAFTATVSGTAVEGRLIILILQNVSQDRDVASVSTDSTTSADQTSVTVTAPGAGSFIVGASVCGQGGSYNAPAGGFTSRDNSAEPSSGHQVVTAAVGAGADTVVQVFNGSANRMSACAFAVGTFVPAVVTYEVAFNGDATPDVTQPADADSDTLHGESNLWIRPGPDATGFLIAQATPDPVPTRQSLISFAISGIFNDPAVGATAVAQLVGVGAFAENGSVSSLVQASAELVGVGATTEAGAVSALVRASAELIGIGAFTENGAVQAEFPFTATGNFVGVGAATENGAVSALVQAAGNLVGVGATTENGSVSLLVRATSQLIGVGAQTEAGSVSAQVQATAELVGPGAFAENGAARALVQASANIEGVGAFAENGSVTASTDFLINAPFVGVGAIAENGSVVALVEASVPIVGVGAVTENGSVQADFPFTAQLELVGVGATTENGSVSVLVQATLLLEGSGSETENGSVSTLVRATADLVGSGAFTENGLVTSSVSATAIAELISVGAATENGLVSALVLSTAHFIGPGAFTENGLVKVPIIRSSTITSASTRANPVTRANTQANPVTRAGSC